MHQKKDTVIAQSPIMQKCLHDIAKVARSDASVFIYGESGTGKEVIAHAIHNQSKRKSISFVKVNCAAIPESLIESEFFGHEKGSFTGAINRRIGRFELADKGTLLLDEVTEIPLSVQSKLLRAVQEQEFERVGAAKTISVDVRFISTSNRKMKDAIRDKLFREDLYYRLNVVPIHLPPLRERREDIIPLAEYFLERVSEGKAKKLSKCAAAKLLDYRWPGNIRELSNVIERTCVMCNEDLILAPYLDIDSNAQQVSVISSPHKEASGVTLKELERGYILETLRSCKNNKTKTARSLGISIRTLRNKLSAYTKM